VDSQTFEYRNENRSPYGALAAAGLVGDGKEKNHATTGMAPFWWRAWGDAVLTTFWTVSDKDSSSPVMKRKSVFRAPVSGSSFSAIVEAQNQTLTAFGREIAAAIQSAQHEMLER